MSGKNSKIVFIFTVLLMSFAILSAKCSSESDGGSGKLYFALPISYPRKVGR